MSFLFPQSTFGRNHHTVRNIPRLDVQKGRQDLFHFEVCRQLFASVWKTLWFCDHLGIFAVFPIIHDTVVPLKIGSLSFSWCCSKFVKESSIKRTSLTKKVQTFSQISAKRRLAVTDLIWDYVLIRFLDSTYSLFLLLLFYPFLHLILFLRYCYFILLYVFTLVYCASST